MRSCGLVEASRRKTDWLACDLAWFALQPLAGARWSFDASRGAAYLHGEETPRRWTQFTHALDGVALNQAHANEAVAGANEAFAAMEAWFRLHGWNDEPVTVAAV